MLFWALVQLVIFIYLAKLIYEYAIAKKPRLPEPPGPRGWPIFGHMFSVGTQPYKAFVEIGKTYGKVFQLQIGVRKTVVLNDIALIKEAYSKQAFAGRPQSQSFRVFLESAPSGFGVRTGNEEWKFLRRTALKALNLFASSKNSRLEDVIEQAQHALEEDLDANAGHPYDPQENIFRTVANVIGAILYGGDFNRQDKMLNPLLDQTERFAKFFQVGSVMDSLPLGQHFMRKRATTFIESIQPLTLLTLKHITEHEARSENEDDIRDVADALVFVARDTPTQVKQKYGIKDDKEIRFIAQDLFGAGFATTMETFRWTLNLLAKNQTAQSKAREEIAKMCGDRRVTLEDRKMLPYNEAVLAEAFRFSSLVPLAIPHCTMEDTSIDDYHIPKGTTILANIYGHHRNPEIFPHPDQFTPERFIRDNGEFGENLARQELAMLLCNTVQKFKIEEDPSEPVNVEDCYPGFVRRPIQTRLIISRV